MKHVQACLSAGKDGDLFSQLWRSCEAGAAVYVLETPYNCVFTVEEVL